MLLKLLQLLLWVLPAPLKALAQSTELPGQVGAMSVAQAPLEVLAPVVAEPEWSLVPPVPVAMKEAAQHRELLLLVLSGWAPHLGGQVV